MAGSESVHARLWKVFTWYALVGNPLQPNLVRCDQFLRLAEDIGALERRGLDRAKVSVIVCKQASVQESGDKRPKRVLSYHAFLNALMEVAAEMFPGAGGKEAAFERCLKECVFKRAKCRNPRSVVAPHDDVLSLLRRFEQPLRAIFEHYASAAELEAIDQGRFATAAIPRATDVHSMTSTSWSSASNSMKQRLRYCDFLSLVKDFGLANSSLLSMQTLGDIFLSSIDNHAFHKQVPKLTFAEFEEALLRCALEIGQHTAAASSPELQFKGLLLIMWRAAHQRGRVMGAIEAHVPRTTNAAALLAGIMLFNNRFAELWAEDDHRDYYTAPKPPPVDAFDIVTHICLNSRAG